MRRFVGNLLLGFGSAGATPPAAPSLTVADNLDGTGAVATIGGSDPGVTNRVYVASLVDGSLAATLAGSRSGDGTLALSLTDGAYEAYCVSVSGSLFSLPSRPYVFRVSGGAVSATSVLALSKASLRTMVSESQTFQAEVGVAAAADALERIYLSAALAKDDREFASLRPFAVVGTHAELSYLVEAGGTKNYFRPGGGIMLYLTQNDRFPDDPAASSVAFDNFAGGVMDDLQAVAALDDNLAITELHLEDWYHSSMDKQKSQTPFWYAIVRVVWEN